MTPLWAVLLSLCVGARAGGVTRVDFVKGAAIPASPVVAQWSQGLTTLFKAAPANDVSGPLARMSGMDWNDPGHAATFEPFANKLAAQSGLTPEAFSALAPERRWALAQAAVSAVSAEFSDQVHAAADKATAALELGAPQALDAIVALLREEAAAGIYLSANAQARVAALHRAALALQTEARAKKALELLRRDAAALGASDPISAVLARSDDQPDFVGRPGLLLKFDASKRKLKPKPKPEPPVLYIKPGQNPARVLKGLMMGLTPQEADRFGYEAGKPRDDLYSRYPQALDAAVAQAKLAGWSAENVYFGEGRMPLAGNKQNWAFTFYLLKSKKDREGAVVTVKFAQKGGALAALASTPVEAAVPEEITPFTLPPYLLNRAFKYEPPEARRYLGDAAPNAEVGLSLIARAIPEPVSYDTDFWYVVADARREYGRVNAATGERRLPPEPITGDAATKTAWERLVAWLKSW